MSGGVGPSADITLPKEHQEESEQAHKVVEDHPPPHKSNPKPTGKSKKSTLLSFYQLNSLAAVIILAASGLVPLSDFAFVLFSLLYLFPLSKFAFPPLPPSPAPSPESSTILNTKSTLLRLYVFVSSLLGIFLPVAYILHGIIHSDKDGIKAAAPHVFLLASQLFMEGFAFSSRFSLPVGIFVPVLFNSRRMFSLADWLRSEFEKSEGVGDAGGGGWGGGARRVYFGRGLAVANVAFWGFNLFGLLLPVAVPISLKKYYSSSSVSSVAASSSKAD